jgi:hypothetical protein
MAEAVYTSNQGKDRPLDAATIFDPLGLFYKKEQPAYYKESKLTPEQEALMQGLEGYYSQFLSGSPSYTGQRISPLTNTQQGILGNINNSTSPLFNQSMGTLSAFAGGNAVNPELYNNYFNENIATPLLSMFKEEALPELRGQMNKKGLLYGSGREKNEVGLSNTLMQTLAQSKTNLALQMDEANKTRAFNASSAIPSVLSGFSNLGTTGVAGLEGEKGQGTLDVSYQDWLRQQPGTRPQDAMLMSLLGLDTYNYIVPGSGGSGQGGGGLLSGLVSSIFG